MKSSPHGEVTLAVEVTNISRHGIWVFAGEKENFLAHDDFPCSLSVRS